MNAEPDNMEVYRGSWEGLIIQELERRTLLQRKIRESPNDEYLLSQLRALDSGLQMMIDKLEVSCLCLPDEWEVALAEWMCEQET